MYVFVLRLLDVAGLEIERRRRRFLPNHIVPLISDGDGVEMLIVRRGRGDLFFVWFVRRGRGVINLNCCEFEN